MDTKYNKDYLSWLFIVLLIIVGAYLTIKATYENSWDGWAFGSAQTMLTIKHWINDGWSTHYFLFVPAGYSKLTKYFRDSNLKHHAWGEITGSPGKREIYYTHFPPGYLFPSALLMELGFKNRFWFRFFQILISLMSLLLLYKFFNLISNKIIAFSAALFYMISVPFLNFADSLANMPIDDLFRFLILFLSVIALKNIGDAKKYNFYNFWIWLAYFILAFSSYDSTFFIFVWLIGLDTLIAKKIMWKKWLFFASAPILAFIIQIIQNSWCLGFSGMTADFIGAFKKIGLGADSNQGFFQMHFLQGILYPITEAFALSFRARYVLISLLIILAVLFILKKNKETEKSIPSVFKYLFLFGLAGFIQSLIVLDNHPYKGRVLGVFAAFLIGAFIFLISRLIKTKPVPRALVFILFSITFFLIFLQIQRTFAYVQQWPNNVHPQQRIDFGKEFRKTLQPFLLPNTIMFSMYLPEPYDNNELIPADITDRYKISLPSFFDMYYYDMPILDFNNTQNMAKDFMYLTKISKYPFSALMIMKDKNQADELIQLLQKTSPKLNEGSIKSFTIQNKYILLINAVSE